MTDTHVRLIPLPLKVEGVTLPNDDGSFDIYINSRLSPARQQETLAHEMRHIRQGYFYHLFYLWKINYLKFGL